MKLVKWNNEPVFPEFFNRLFNDDFENTFVKRNCGYIPSANILDKEASFEVEFAVPGMKREDFKITVENNVLSVSAEKEEAAQEKEKNYTRKEFAYGAFTRSFALPKLVDVEKISAAYDNGILTVVLPKKEEAKTQTLREINIS
jgi:HSP20 family protein